MSQYLSHPPSLQGVIPKIQWQTLTTSDNQHLTQLCHIKGQWHQLTTCYQFPFGYFKCIGEETSFFIKIIPQNKATTVKLSNIVALYLKEFIEVNCILNEFSQQNIVIDQQHSDILIYPLLETRLCNFSSEDLSNIAISLAHFHNALLNYPEKNQVKIDSQKRLEQLKTVWQKFNQSVSSLSNPQSTDELIPQAVANILTKENECLLDVLSKHAQMIHGDLNVGNILFKKDEVLLIDFENSLYSYMTPLYDISYIIQRFIINKTQSNDQIEPLVTRFLAIYLQHYKKAELISSLIKYQSNIIPLILRASAVFCLLILAKQQIEHAVKVEKAEWDKFINFYQNSQLLEP